MTAHEQEASQDVEFWIGTARAFGGAIFFAMPLLMTMEMWHLGFYMSPWRLALMMLLMIPLLTGLSRFSGFRDTPNWKADLVDACVACGIGASASAAVLFLIQAIDPSMRMEEVVGKIVVQTVPASFGAMLARSQFGERTKREKEKEREAGYGGELLLMAAGALFFAFNVAPTEEIILIAYRIDPGRVAALILTSLVLMQAFVYAVNFRGGHQLPEGSKWWIAFGRFTAAGYLLALAISAYVLWTFGRIDATQFMPAFQATVVLAFPASLGAAAARLIL